LRRSAEGIEGKRGAVSFEIFFFDQAFFTSLKNWRYFSFYYEILLFPKVLFSRALGIVRESFLAIEEYCRTQAIEPALKGKAFARAIFALTIAVIKDNFRTLRLIFSLLSQINSTISSNGFWIPVWEEISER